ncbi:MAG TPA: DUF4367 domain-containing protein [Candidatus Mediterraneibacter quadrami]|uniref:DUF4367 domain-containing protein n=1 Tax=Candidatus Mediterraneibacter quadrami TaxID=2838684 RepID=A0A9D2RE49_9FIRM|nr:DUF4367 domain-containing protein [Candidatus Mediterraneibacter quadrami]
MKELKKLSLKEELDREAEKIEEEVGKRRDLDDLTVSEEAETALFNKIQDYEYDKRFKKTVHRSRKKRRILLAVAAVLVLICGSVITGTGSKSYLKVLMERITGEDSLTNIDVENMDAQTTDDLDEIYIFKEINKETGISPVHFGYIPEEMHLKRYEVNTELGSAELLYDYKGQTIQYSMYMNDADSSHGYTESDKLVNEYKITTEKQIDVVIQEYSVVNQDFHRFTAEFEYHNAQYQLVGLMEKEEFDQIIQKLRFYD